jgi:hypothetical protein
MGDTAQTLTFFFAALTVMLDVVLALLVLSRITLDEWLPKRFGRDLLVQHAVTIAAVSAVSAVGLAVLLLR